MDINKQQTTTNNNHISPSCAITMDDALLFNGNLQDIGEMHNEVLRLLGTAPDKALELLLVLTKKYDDEPMLASHLVNAYSLTDNEELSQQTVRNNYRRFPLFLIARCEYAELCLEENKIMEAAAAFDYTFDPIALYPKKSSFHIVEIVAFQSVLTKYFCALKDFNRAVFCIDQLAKIDPNIPVIQSLNAMVIFSVLEENLSMQNVTRLLRRMEESAD